MYYLLLMVKGLPLTESAVHRFLSVAARWYALDIITIDDWKYLATLVNYRISKKMILGQHGTSQAFVEKGEPYES